MWHLRLATRWCVAAAFLALSAGCATPPSNSVARAPSGLNLCNKKRISNAPAADRTGRIKTFTAYTNVRGVTLVRAPVAGCLSSGFGPRRGGAGSIHKGIDLYTKGPQPIGAAASGRIVSTGYVGGFGRTIILDHGRGVTTLYGHLSDYAPGIRRGKRVSAGDIIGRTGKSGNATGIHLHYEIRLDQRAINPLE